MNNQAPVINSSEVLGQYDAGEYDKLSEFFLQILAYLGNARFIELSPQQTRYINAFIKLFLDIFTRDDFVVNRRYYIRFINSNPVISNLLCLTQYETTDSWLQNLLAQKNNLIKILTLYSHRNRTTIDETRFFDLNPELASRWYAFNLKSADSYITKASYENCIRLINNIDHRLSYQGIFSISAYMRCSYIDPANDRIYKHFMNNRIKPIFKNFDIQNQPDNRSIAIVTGRWSRNSAVFKSNYKMIEALADYYRLTLVKIEVPGSAEIDTTYFDDVKPVRFVNNQLDLSSILNNDFGLAYFPDVGMVDISCFLCNARIAPIQVMGYGHPVSTFGSEIDYLIGGKDIENYDDVESDYTERLLLVPGLGVTPVFPGYVPENKDANLQNDSEIIINCAWGAHKINYQIIQILKQIAEETGYVIKYQFLQTAILDGCSFVAGKKELEKEFGNVKVFISANNNMENYMKYLNRGHFAIDSYPFGGYNTIVDNLILGKPVVTWEGERSFNRLASGLLRQVGLTELITTDRNGYIELIKKLILDNNYRNEVTERISTLDIRNKLINENNPVYFRHAIDYLLSDNRQHKDTRKPVLIE